MTTPSERVEIGQAAERDRKDRLQRAVGDRYRIDHAIGEGGMATVFLAEDLKHGRKVAGGTQVLRPRYAPGEFAARFEVIEAARITLRQVRDADAVEDVRAEVVTAEPAGEIRTVFVWPGLTSRNAPLPAWTEFRSTPVSSKTSTPMSRGAESTLLHTKAVSRLLFLMTPTAV